MHLYYDDLDHKVFAPSKCDSYGEDTAPIEFQLGLHIFKSKDQGFGYNYGYGYGYGYVFGYDFG